jgi:hypothetical protein
VVVCPNAAAGAARRIAEATTALVRKVIVPSEPVL